MNLYKKLTSGKKVYEGALKQHFKSVDIALPNLGQMIEFLGDLCFFVGYSIG